MKNLTQMRTASCDEEASNMGTLVRMDVGAILTSTNDRGAIPVILRDRILYEEPMELGTKDTSPEYGDRKAADSTMELK